MTTTLAADLLNDVEAMSSVFPGYAKRPGQIQATARAEGAIRYGAGAFLGIEAPTGTGKTLIAGLTAGLLAQEGRVTLIVTPTIQLQEQYVLKDLPTVCDILRKTRGVDVQVGILKGAANYRCSKREMPKDKAILKVLGGDHSRLTQARADISTLRSLKIEEKRHCPPELLRVWRFVAADPTDCTMQEHPECARIRAKLHAMESDIVVTNIAMLALNEKTGLRAIPEYDALILDEAHEVPGHMRDQDKAELKISNPGIEWATPEEAAAIRGVLGDLAALVADAPIPSTNDIKYAPDDSELFFAPHRAVEIDETTSELLSGALGRVSVAVMESKAAAKLGKALSALTGKTADDIADQLCHMLDDDKTGAVQRILDADDTEAALLAALAASNEAEDIKALYRGSEALLGALLSLPEWTTVDASTILSVHVKGGEVVALGTQPAFVAETIREINRRVPIVAMSATMADGEGSWRSIMNQFGFTEPPQRGVCKDPHDDTRIGLTLTVDSPFNLGRSIILNACPRGVGAKAPKRNEFEPFDFYRLRKDQAWREWAKSVARACYEAGSVHSGRVLCLTTSNKSAAFVADLLSENTGYKVILAGSMEGGISKAQAIDIYKKYEGDNCILIGSKGLWTGLDLPGGQLMSVVIDKLPYGVPSDPVNAWMARNYRAAGFSDQYGYSTAKMGLDIRQGIGRGVRTTTDRVTIYVVDHRIVTQSRFSLRTAVAPYCSSKAIKIHAETPGEHWRKISTLIQKRERNAA